MIEYSRPAKNLIRNFRFASLMIIIIMLNASNVSGLLFNSMEKMTVQFLVPFSDVKCKYK